MAGEADGLVVDALHQAAVAGERPGTMIDQIVAEYGAEVPLRNGHADRHREALSHRSRRRLDTRQRELFGVSGARRIELPEVAGVLHRRLLRSAEAQNGVDQHRPVTGREAASVQVMHTGSWRSALPKFREQNATN